MPACPSCPQGSHLRIEAYLRPATRQDPARFVSLADLTVDVADMPHYVMTQDGLLATMGGEMAASTEDQNISSSQESGAVLIVESIPLI